MSQLKYRVIGTYSIFTIGAWFISFMMEQNGIPREIWNFYEFMCACRRILSIPPLLIAGFYALHFIFGILSEIKFESKPRKSLMPEQPIPNLKFPELPPMSPEEFERLQKRREAERAKVLDELKESERIKAERIERERKEIERRKTRSAKDAAKKALEDF